MPPLYTYTVAEAEKLSPEEAKKLVNMHNNLHNVLGEAFDKELEGYVRQDESGKDYVGEVTGGTAMWAYWKQKYEDGEGFPGVDELKDLTVLQAAGLHPEVEKVLKAKAEGAAKTDISFADMVALFRKDPTNRKRYDDSMGRNDDYGRDSAKAMVTNWYPNHLKKAAAKAAAAAAPTPGGGRKGHASTLRGIGKMGPAMLHKELERYEKIKAHLQSKYAHVVPMGETKRYTKEEVDSAIKQLKDKIAAKGAGGRRGTRRTRRRTRSTRSTRALTARRR